MNYILHILVIISLYSLLAVSLNIMVGFTGLISLSHASFFGIGAYSVAIVTTVLGLPFWAGLLLGIVIALVFSALISLASLRLNGDYFVISTLAFQIAVYCLIYNWVNVTRGPMGVSKIPFPHLPGLSTNARIDFVIFAFLVVSIGLFLCFRISLSPFGQVLKGIREDEMLMHSYAKNVLYYKFIVISIMSVIAAVVGSIYAAYVTFIDPTTFNLNESLFLLSIVLLGGSDFLLGTIFATIVLVSLPEAFRFIGIPTGAAANIRQIMYGVAIIGFILFRPHGLYHKYHIGKM